MPNDGEALNRLRKALRFADILQAGGVSSALAQGASTEDRALAARMCGWPDYQPSEATWAEVVRQLAAREKAVDDVRRMSAAMQQPTVRESREAKR